VPRHPFLPGQPPAVAYVDDAVVTHRHGRLPTSSSSQPSLMAAMLAQLDVRPGHRVLEVGTGTGWNAALLAALGAAVTTIEIQPEVAAAAREALAATGWDEVEVVTGDGGLGHADRAPYDRIVVTAGAWELAPAWLEQLADGGVLVVPLRVNGSSVSVAYRKAGQALAATGALHCGFMPLQGAHGRVFRWPLNGGDWLSADVELTDGERGWLSTCLSDGDGEETAASGDEMLDRLLWLGLQGRPIVQVFPTALAGPRRWSLAVLGPERSALAFDFAEPRAPVVTGVRACGGRGALDAVASALADWRAAGAPGPERLRGRVAAGNGLGPLPAPAGGRFAFARGAHRHELWFAGDG